MRGKKMSRKLCYSKAEKISNLSIKLTFVGKRGEVEEEGRGRRKKEHKSRTFIHPSPV